MKIKTKKNNKEERIKRSKCVFQREIFNLCFSLSFFFKFFFKKFFFQIKKFFSRKKERRMQFERKFE